MKAFTFIREIFKKFPRLLIITVGLSVLVSVIEATSILTVGPLVDFLIHPNLQDVTPFTHWVTKIMEVFGIPLRLGGYLTICIIFIILGSAFRILARHSILKTIYAVVRDLMLGTFEDFFNARWYFFSSSEQGTLLNTFSRELTAVGNAFSAMSYFFTSLLRFVFCLAIPFCLSWQVTIISLLAAFLLSWPFILLGKISYRLGKLTTTTANKISSVIQENLALAKVVLGFGNQQQSVGNLDHAFNAHRKVAINSQTIGIAIPTLYRPLGVIVVGIALFSARRFGVSISNMAVLLLALLQSVISIGDLTSHKHSLDNLFPSYEQIKNLRHRAKQLRQKSGTRIFTGFDNEIVIEKLSFAYPGREPTLLNTDMRIPKGKMIAIVGESGAGKSTLIDMIMGFNEPQSGRIMFDGVNLQEFDINSYRKRIGYVPQDSILFNMSIKDNLLWANEKATDAEIKYACRQAYADEFIEEFPDGYNTLVGDFGVRLSGGQRQRIALARAILRKPDLLILDEATSSLDTRSERLIQQAIENISKETTILVIAHRLSTIVNADYVYTLKKGQVIEKGTYSELIQAEGHFNRMVKLQTLEIT